MCAIDAIDIGNNEADPCSVIPDCVQMQHRDAQMHAARLAWLARILSLRLNRLAFVACPDAIVLLRQRSASRH